MRDSGIVYLVGAGPGDPGLLTVRGLECLQKADTVVYDYLANPVLLDHASGADECIYVGKRAGDHTMTQVDICSLLVDRARAGRTVVRLKGGDPFVFGRGGEEALALADAGVRFEVVPGVTAAVAAPAYAGIPVTQRTCNSVLTLVTGHEDPTKQETAIDWRALAQGGGTLAFYMGVRNLPRIVQRLVAHGRAPDTPVALIRHGTLPVQRVVSGTLDTIVALAEAAEITPPAMIVVGDVVGLRERLRWFDTKPLFGVTVVVTRSRTQASSFAALLARQGVHVVQLPTITIAEAEQKEPLRNAVGDLSRFDWILFTSVNGVSEFFRTVHECGGDSRWLAGCRVGAIGSATGAALRQRGVVPDLVPERFTSQALLAALIDAGAVDGRHLLLAQADIAPSTLADGLREAGGTVTAATAYRTVPAEPCPEALELLESGGADVVTFTSSSTVRNFVAMMREHCGDMPAGVRYASIGPETSRTARAAGLDIAVEADPHTIPALVDALAARFGGVADRTV